MEAGENETKNTRLKKTTEVVWGNGKHENDRFNFSVFDIFLLIFSVFSIITDMCTDLTLVFQYSSQGYKAWAAATFLLIFFPSLIVQFFSLKWHIEDKTVSLMHWIIHFCLLGIIHRYIQIIKAAAAAYKSKNLLDIQKIYLDQNDLCMLHLFESFLESAPQLVLQIYISAMLHEWRFWTVLSGAASLVSLAWALAAYTKIQRRARPNKNSCKWPGLLLQAIWRTGMLTSRISTLVLGAYCFGNYIFILITLHWLAMTVWIVHQKTDFCETYWEEKLYNAVIGVIYCFSFFNLQEGQSRWRVLVFYFLIVFQNLTCLTVFLMWFGERNSKLAVCGFIAIVGGTVLGSASMIIYYGFFHPSGPIKFFIATESIPNHSPENPYSTHTLRTLKRKRGETQSDSCQKSTQSLDLNDSKRFQNSLSDSVVIVEENALDEKDSDIEILRNWINESNDKSPTKVDVEKNVKEMEKDAYKRRAICSSVDLVKMLKSGTESDGENIKIIGSEEAPSDILSAHDYENLCAVNIARETWGLRSWRGYSDIETWLHDDSVVYDRRLDTLTSTTSSDRSGNTLQKENDRTEKEEYADAEELGRCDSETSSDLGHYSIDYFPLYPLGALDPIFEETEESSDASTELNDLKIRNGSVSTLVATIDEIRRNTPTQNRYRSDSVHKKYGVLGGRSQESLKKVTFASKLLTYLGNEGEKNEKYFNKQENAVKSALQMHVNHEFEISNKENIAVENYRRNLAPDRITKAREKD